MPVCESYLTYTLEQLAPAGTLQAKKMFGEVGLYCEDIFFAIIADDTLYFKVDDRNRPDYEMRDMEAFRPYVPSRRKRITMSYYQVPVEILEDQDELCRWAQQAISVAVKSGRI